MEDEIRHRSRVIFCNRQNNWSNLPMKCPKKGSFIGYKIVVKDKYSRRHPIIQPNSINRLCLLKLEIPEDAERLSPILSGSLPKCRCDKVKVLQAYDVQKYLITKDLRKCRIKDQKIFYSYYNRDFEYSVGETISVDNFDDDRWKTCSTGIHFFRKKEDAMRYFAIPIELRKEK